MHNYDSAYAIYLALEHYSITRLKLTFGRIRTQFKNQLNQIHELLKYNKNFIAYKTALAAVPTSTPCIPIPFVYFSILLVLFIYFSL